MPKSFVVLALAFQTVTSSCSGPSTPATDASDPRSNYEKTDTSFIQVGAEHNDKAVEFAKKHDADMEWMKLLERPWLYTVELQRALMEPPDRHRFFVAWVADVQERDGAYFLTTWGGFRINDVYLELECDPQQVEYFLSACGGSQSITNFAFIFLPESVQKPLLAVSTDGEDVSLSPTSGAILVKGKCVDILLVDNCIP